jgi:predicted protein tyrosine phosphatase
MEFPFGMTICGLDELGGHCAIGVSHVLSILDPAWPIPEAFGTYGEHRRLELRFHDVIEDTVGMLAPQEEDITRLLAFGRDMLAEPPAMVHLLVHCHAGVSRSTASMVLILAQARPQLAEAKIFHELLRIRPRAWPNLRIIEIGDNLLRRGGRLVDAANAVYRQQLHSRPDLAVDMQVNGRAREVAGALAGQNSTIS